MTRLMAHSFPVSLLTSHFSLNPSTEKGLTFKKTYLVKKYLVFAFLLPVQLWAQSFSKEETTRWQQQARQVQIIEDDWGIPHVYGKTDACAVFGHMYVQCEHDF